MKTCLKGLGDEVAKILHHRNVPNRRGDFGPFVQGRHQDGFEQKLLYQAEGFANRVGSIFATIREDIHELAVLRAIDSNSVLAQLWMLWGRQSGMCWVSVSFVSVLRLPSCKLGCSVTHVGSRFCGFDHWLQTWAWLPVSGLNF